jgi:hypothetical protein
MTTLIKVEDKTVAIEQTLAKFVRHTGTLKPLRIVAEERGISKADKEGWKSLRTSYNEAKSVFGRRVKEAMALAATSPDLKGTKALVKFDDAGNVKSAAFSVRSLSAADVKANQKHAERKLAEENKALSAQIEEMKAQLAALTAGK